MSVKKLSIQIHDKLFEIYLPATDIQKAVNRMAKKISVDYNHKNLVFVIALKGAMVFASDLIRSLTIPCEIEVVRAHSYGSSMTSSGNVIVECSSMDLADRDVLILEDIAETGQTIETLIRDIQSSAPRSVKVAALLLKTDLYQRMTPPDYIGFEISPAFVVGYGMDYNEKGRNLQDIYILSTKNL